MAELDLLAVLSEQHNASMILAEQFPAVPLELEKLSYKFLKQFKVLPLDLEDNLLTMAMADPSDTETLESIRLFPGYETKIHLGLEHEISDALERFYGSGDGLLGKPFDSGDKLIGITLDLGAA